MTEKRFYLMNVEDPLHEYGRWCKPVLEDGETGKQYEDALEVMDLLNAFVDDNEQLKSEIEGMKELLKSYRKTIKHDAKLLADATSNGYLPPLEEWREI